MRFLTPLRVELNQDGTGRLLSDFRFVSDKRGKAYTVPEGFCTDFASTPRVPVAYLLAGNTAHWAAVIHDYCYHEEHYVTKEEADAIFDEAMEAQGVPAWRRKMMFAGVSVFGGSSYKGDPRQ